ncbi:MAG: Rne/Rng family ribonuclease [Desulfuromonadales bacterium]|nr:Rne/Rng family ribonuclease [Desulfuromonadales bacterium]MBN2791416.1 Rne/Rng family ribonuclease [Desulfuromonadales bacterium]
MSKKMLINASHPEENRVAIVVDGVLSELDIELAGKEQTKGNIYKAVVVRVETGLQAAFVDYGAEKLGFLQIGEIHPSIYPNKDESKSRPRIADILNRGQEILVQIVKEERGNKGAALTTFLSIPGRYMVLMPDSTTKGVSRKITDESERKKLKRTMAELDLPENMGYIVRTAGIGKDKDELKRDFDYLVRLYEGIVARQDQIKAPAQLYQESNLTIRSIRDYFSTDMDEVLIDDQAVYQDTRDFFALVMPELQHLVKRHRERRPIFSRYQIEEQIDGLSKNQIPLPSGGSIVIDQTEALVAIDVNSGKMASESGIEATAIKTNMEAAAEVGRQLRLRDLGGLVVIDFIDMRDRKNIREVEQELRKSLKDDKAKVSVGRISQFGLMEMSRQRLKPTLSVGAYEECPHCKGIGRIKSIEAQAVNLLRQAHTAASKGQIGLIEAIAPVEVANYLLNQKRKAIVDLERQLNLRLLIHGRAKMLPGDLELEIHKREKTEDESRKIMPISHANQIEVALAAQQEVKENSTPEETTEVPGEEPTETKAPEDAPKKRRRRRRKKPVPAQEQNLEQESQPQQPETDSLAPAAQTPVQIEVEAPEEVPVPTAEQPEQEPPKEQEKPKRRTRRPARKKPAQKPQTEAGSVKAPGSEAEETGPQQTQQKEPEQQSPAETQLAETAVAKTTPAKKPRRTTRKKAQAEPQVKTDSPEEIPAHDPAGKPQAKRRRTSTKAPAPKNTETETQAPLSEPGSTDSKPQPKRRTGRKTQEPKESAGEKPQGKEKSTADEGAPAGAAVSAGDKPKRRPRKIAKKDQTRQDGETSGEQKSLKTNHKAAEVAVPDKASKE